ncbi:MAG TPA: DNA recombination/repair protein RecA, partial [Myxococcaceae bacterium]|nr:DNA recombination/repair protein RecA [Myxococcaceae bacterium]
GVGVDRHGEAVDLGVERGLLEKSGAWFSIGGERIAQGRERATDWLRERPQVLEALAARLIEAPPPAGQVSADAAAA